MWYEIKNLSDNELLTDLSFAFENKSCEYGDLKEECIFRGLI